MTLVLLPGVGADARLFAPQRAAFPELVVPPWIAPLPRETLPAYARRFAEALRPLADPELVLGGVSFGGMLACELARHLPARDVLLIASASSRDAVPAPLRALARLVRRAPLRLFRPSRLVSQWVESSLRPCDGQAWELARAMWRASDPAFVRWALGAIARWPRGAPPPVPVRAIHGRADRVLRLRRVRPDEVIDGAGHLLNLTHPEPVNAFLRRHAG